MPEDSGEYKNNIISYKNTRDSHNKASTGGEKAGLGWKCIYIYIYIQIYLMHKKRNEEEKSQEQPVPLSRKLS